MEAELWQIVTFALLVQTACLQIAGIVAPVWIWLNNGDHHVGIGLFFRIGYERDGAAPTPDGFGEIRIDDEDTLKADHWYGIVVAELLSTFLTMVLIPMLYAHYDRLRFNLDTTLVYYISVAVSVFAAIFNLIGLLIFLIYHGDAIRDAPEIGRWSFAWGGLIMGVAILLQVVISMVIYRRMGKDSKKALPGPMEHPFSITNTTPDLNQMFHGHYPNFPRKAFSEDLMRTDYRQDYDDRFDDVLHQWPRPSSVKDVLYKRPIPPPVPKRPFRNLRKAEGDVYQNLSNFQKMHSNEVGIGSAGFTQPTPLWRSNAFPKHIKTNVLERRDEPHAWNKELSKDIVNSRIHQKGVDTSRESLIREIENANAARKMNEEAQGLGRFGSELNFPRDDNSTVDEDPQLSPFNTDYIFRPYSELI